MHGWSVSDWTGFASAVVLILGALGGAMAKILGTLKEIRVSVDGKMTELVEMTRQLALAEGRDQMRAAAGDPMQGNIAAAAGMPPAPAPVRPLAVEVESISAKTIVAEKLEAGPKEPP